MIAGLSKAITLYLAPVLMLTTLFLTIFAFFSPSAMLHDQVALLTVSPSTRLVQAGPGQNIDGPSVFLGLLGSCSKTSNSAPIKCTDSFIEPVYDLSALPDKAPETLLSPITMSTPAFLAVALSFSILFFVSHTMISFRHKMGAGLQAKLDLPLVQRLSAWIGFFGFIIGLSSYLIVRMWFEKAIMDFNANIALQGEAGPKLMASAGNAFTMAWVGYAFYSVPLIVSLSKLNVQMTKEA